MVLGAIEHRAGMITRLGRIGARSPSSLAAELGYRKDRLAAGYAIGVLIEPLRATEVEFGGLTIRSGGRDGLPQADPAADEQRTRVHQRMLREQGSAAVAGWQKSLAGDTRNLLGSDRIIKIFPVTPHLGKNPADEYPMGGGSPQWILTSPHAFLIALEVAANGLAQTISGWRASVADNAPYEDRAKLARYLETVTAR